nr:L,D-transpeptidase family protein [Maliibacterium massiliense]
MYSVPQNCTQALVCLFDAPHRPRARLFACACARGAWRIALPMMRACGGRGGLTTFKCEGDGRTPAGVFPLAQAMGTLPARGGLPYRRLCDQDVWIDDPRAPHYNTLQTRAFADCYAASYETLCIPDYAHMIVIAYNTHPVRAGAGSAIFLHLRLPGKNATAGCIAVYPGDMDALLDFLQPHAHPHIILAAKPACLQSELARLFP